MNKLVTSEEIESVIKHLPTQTNPGEDSCIGKFYKAFKEELIPILSKLFKKMEKIKCF